MKRLFTVDDKYHGSGRVNFVWHRNHLACAGANGLVHVFNRQGEQIDEIALNSRGRVIIDWDYEGEHLAVLQEGGETVTIWNLSSRCSLIYRVRKSMLECILDCDEHPRSLEHRYENFDTARTT